MTTPDDTSESDDDHIEKIMPIIPTTDDPVNDTTDDESDLDHDTLTENILGLANKYEAKQVTSKAAKNLHRMNSRQDRPVSKETKPEKGPHDKLVTEENEFDETLWLFPLEDEERICCTSGDPVQSLKGLFTVFLIVFLIGTSRNVLKPGSKTQKTIVNELLPNSNATGAAKCHHNDLSCMNQRAKGHVQAPDEIDDDGATVDVDDIHLHPENEQAIEQGIPTPLEVLDQAGEISDIIENKTKVLDAHQNETLAKLAGFADLKEPFTKSEDIAVFFHVPRCGGVSVEELVSVCYNLAEASQIGVAGHHEEDQELQLIEQTDGGHYVNIDTTTRSGIQKAKEFNLVPSGLVDVIFTSYLYDLGELFSPKEKRGRCFVFLRHPVDRAMSMYYAMLDSEPRLSLDSFVRYKYTETNWVTRFLSNKEEGAVYENDFEVAKRVLHDKCLIGLLDKFEESVHRFEHYFGWRMREQSAQMCRNEIISHGLNRADNVVAEELSPELKAMVKTKNYFDLKLYEYAKEVWEDQSVFMMQKSSYGGRFLRYWKSVFSGF